MEYYAALKMNKIMKFLMCMILVDIMLTSVNKKGIDTE